jgi:catechol 2,3-dioxygenase-like lactoylglutathione lyase family enzyme
MSVRIEHFGVYSRDTKALADWYVGTLGFRIVRTLEKEGRPPIYFLSGADGGEIEILPTSEPYAKRTLSQGGFSHIGLIVDDFGAMEAKLQQHGVALQGVRTTSNGWTIGYAEDPDGNTIEFVER